MIVTHNNFSANVNTLNLGKGRIALFSYTTLVLLSLDNIDYIDEAKYSRTTNKHISAFKSHNPAKYVSQQELQRLLKKFFYDQVIKETLT